MYKPNAPLVIDGVNGQEFKAVWAERGTFYCRAGAGKVQCEIVVPGVFKTIPGTYEDKPQPKRLPEWKRRANARAQS